MILMTNNEFQPGLEKCKLEINNFASKLFILLIFLKCQLKLAEKVNIKIEGKKVKMSMLEGSILLSVNILKLVLTVLKIMYPVYRYSY